MSTPDNDLFNALTLLLGRERVAQLAVSALTPDELRAVLREHTLLIHPDRVQGGSPTRTKRFQKVSRAYERIREALNTESAVRASASDRPNGSRSSGTGSNSTGPVKPRSCAHTTMRRDATRASSPVEHGTARDWSSQPPTPRQPPGDSAPSPCGHVVSLAESLRSAGRIARSPESPFEEV